MAEHQELPASADVVVIGGGVCGCFIARELARYDLDIVVIEKGPDVCSGASKGNGGTVHSGVNTDHGTLKAKLCVPGNRVFADIAAELDWEDELGDAEGATPVTEIEAGLGQLREAILGLRGKVDDLAQKLEEKAKQKKKKKRKRRGKKRKRR